MNNHEEEKYLEIREKLRNLPKVTASDNFVTRLQHSINTLDAELVSTTIHNQNVEKIEKGFFSRFFGENRNPWLVPSLGFTVLIFLILIAVYSYNISSTNETATTQINSTAPENLSQQNNTPSKTNTENNQSLTTGSNNSNQKNQTPTGSTDSQKDTETIASLDIETKKGSIDSYSSKGPSEKKVSSDQNFGNESGNFKSAVKPNILSETSISDNLKDSKPDSKKESMMSPSKKKSSVNETNKEEKPYDDGGGLSLDDLKKTTSNSSRNIKTVNSIDKSTLERISEELNK
ncbi:MAG TPA: hypothetical protein PLG90_05430 [Ignavibacteria bacterium]|nr:hypothetical protein [Ignavibacteria bacterium]